MANEEYRLSLAAEDINETLNSTKSKVDKIDYDSRTSTGDWHVGLYGELSGNKHMLATATPSAEANTIAKRDAAGAISVSIGIKDSEGNNYTGGAAPHTWVNDRFNELNLKLYDFKNTASDQNSSEIAARKAGDTQLQNELTSQVDSLKAADNEILTSVQGTFNAFETIMNAKKITKYTIEPGQSLALKLNALYLFIGDGETNTFSLLNNGAVIYEGTSNEITAKFGLICIPSNTMGFSTEYPPSYYSVALIEKTILGMPSLSSKKFSVLKEVMENGGLTARENSGSSTFSVWEVAL